MILPQKGSSQPESHSYWKETLLFQLNLQVSENSEWAVRAKRSLVHPLLPCTRLRGSWLLPPPSSRPGPRRPQCWILGSGPSRAGGERKGKKPAFQGDRNEQVTRFPPETCVFPAMILLPRDERWLPLPTRPPPWCPGLPHPQAPTRPPPWCPGSLRLTGFYPSPAQSAGTRTVIPQMQAKEGLPAPRARELCFTIAQVSRAVDPPTAAESTEQLSATRFLTSFHYHLLLHVLSGFPLARICLGFVSVPH